jgi:hypothetical protein
MTLLIIVAIVTVALWAFFYPTIVAFKRGTHTRWWVLVLNLFFGWTMVGWFICLLWAYGPTTADLQYVIEREQLAIEADRAIVALERRSRP